MNKIVLDICENMRKHTEICVGPKPFSSKYAKAAHVRTSPYLDAVG